MIIEIEPGACVDVPADADFQVRMETSFGALELADVATVVSLPYRTPTGAEGEITGQVSGTDLIFLVTAGLLTPGAWTINPKAFVSGFTRRWPRPATLVVQSPLLPGAGVNCGC